MCVVCVHAAILVWYVLFEHYGQDMTLAQIPHRCQVRSAMLALI